MIEDPFFLNCSTLRLFASLAPRVDLWSLFFFVALIQASEQNRNSLNKTEEQEEEEEEDEEEEV